VTGWLPPVCPTAAQKVLVGQLTEKRPIEARPGTSSRVHACPFQRSIRVPPLDWVAYEPTAAQNVVDAQLTDIRPLPDPGLGDGTMDQVLPFHSSTSAWFARPTAMQNCALTQLTD
jgi:hypothetical protein